MIMADGVNEGARSHIVEGSAVIREVTSVQCNNGVKVGAVLGPFFSGNPHLSAAGKQWRLSWTTLCSFPLVKQCVRDNVVAAKFEEFWLAEKRHESPEPVPEEEEERKKKHQRLHLFSWILTWLSVYFILSSTSGSGNSVIFTTYGFLPHLTSGFKIFSYHVLYHVSGSDLDFHCGLW